jgi:hypothetical protein
MENEEVEPVASVTGRSEKFKIDKITLANLGTWEVELIWKERACDRESMRLRDCKIERLQD